MEGVYCVSEQSKICMYIAAHKKFILPSIEHYVPIEVGAALRDEHFCYIRDDEGENISAKNPFFCELTAYYWIWKNSDADIVGLSHYRRYFSKYRINPDERYYLKPEEMEALMEQYDVVLPEHFYWRKHNLKSGYYAGAGVEPDLDTIAQIIQELYPEYSKTYQDVLSQHEASYCNMFVMKKKDFDAYCKWLFDILFEAERRINISDYTSAEKRIFGYMSELLLNVWVARNQKRVCYKPMVVNETFGKKKKVLRICEKIGLDALTKAVYCVDSKF